VSDLLAVITVACDGRPAEAVRRALGGETLLARAVRQTDEIRPATVVISLPDDVLAGVARAAGAESVVRPPDCRSLEEALEHARTTAATPPRWLLAIDPLLPLRRPGRLREALAVARRERAGCVFSCHRESALLWQRSPMGLVPYFDPASRPGLGSGADDLPWLREDGGFYLLDAAAFADEGTRHAGRIVPLETEPAEGVRVADASGLAVCRALLAEWSRPPAQAAVARG
jgi:CMP-N-acetylneuraminic acid synthetase